MKAAAKRDLSRWLCAHCQHWKDEHSETMFGAECHGKNPHPDDASIKCQCAGFVWKVRTAGREK